MISIATFRALLPTTFIKRMKLNTLPCAIYYQVLKHLFPIFLPPYVTHIARSNRRKQVAIETGSIEKTVRHSTNQVQHYETHKHNKPTSRLVMVTLYSSQTMLPGLRARSEFAWITKTSWRYYKAGASPTSHPPPPPPPWSFPFLHTNTSCHGNGVFRCYDAFGSVFSVVRRGKSTRTRSVYLPASNIEHSGIDEGNRKPFPRYYPAKKRFCQSHIIDPPRIHRCEKYFVNLFCKTYVGFHHLTFVYHLFV